MTKFVSMTPFLQAVATELVARHRAELPGFIVVLPHKRGATYLSKHLSDRLEGAPGPQIMTIAQFIARYSGLQGASRLELLFTLFDVYRHLHPQPLPSEGAFEEFRTWGETVISDFNEVDMYDVHPEQIFRNMAGYNRIATDFLTPAQKEVIGRYFGITNPDTHIERFWKHLRPGRAAQDRFLNLWDSLLPLYTAFRKKLLEQRKSYPGLALLTLCGIIQERGKGLFPNTARICFVGFNALSTAERKLFALLRDLKLADFFWDAPGPALTVDSPVQAAHFLHLNAAEFPCSVSDMNRYDASTTQLPPIDIVACPGNVAQAKTASLILEQIITGNGRPYIEPARVAVILPDEGLLFPMFHSIPGQIVEKANITMGYPLRLTAVHSFVALLRNAHSHARYENGQYRYLAADITPLLSHPLTRAHLGQRMADHLNSAMLTSHPFFLTIPDLERALLHTPGGKPLLQPFCEDEISKLRNLLSPLPADGDPTAVCNQLAALLTVLQEDLAQTQNEYSPQAAHIDTYVDALHRFGELCTSHHIGMSVRSTLSMIFRTLASETIPMQGQPLSGLQLMGMLESRALDFDYLIILSMNESIYPRRQRPRTFIPQALRLGYGIATPRFQEEIFAYHFYRLIARAREVYLLYDSSSFGLHSGDPSRYLLQLEHLLPVSRLTKTTVRHSISTHTPPTRGIPKTGVTEQKLMGYLGSDPARALSASALKKYLACPLQFCVANVLGKRVSDPPSEFMDARAIGNVLHHTLQDLYDSLGGTPSNGVTVTAEILRGWINGSRPAAGKHGLQALVEENIRREYTAGQDNGSPLTGDATLMLDPILVQVRRVLDTDLRFAPFTYLGSEIERRLTYRTVSGLEVGMTMVIDRLDRVRDDNGREVLRIVDYKTGSDPNTFKKVADLFSPSQGLGALFQLMMYARLLPAAFPELSPGAIAVSLYRTRQRADGTMDTAVWYGNHKLMDVNGVMEEFTRLFDEMLDNLFTCGAEQYFMPGEGLPNLDPYKGSPCNYCSYSGLCLT